MKSNNQGRLPTDEVTYWYNQEYLGPEKKPYGMFQFELSNQIIEVIRIYPTVVNLFQQIGGVAQIFMFVFVYLMIYNNEVVIELYLLNHGVLMNPHEQKDPTSKKTNRVADASMKKHRTSVPAYTYWEVLIFKLLTCCKKNSPRYR